MTWIQKLRYLELKVELLLLEKKDVVKIFQMRESSELANYLHLEDVNLDSRMKGWCIVLFLKVFKNNNEGKTVSSVSLVEEYSKNEKDEEAIYNSLTQLKILGILEIDNENYDVTINDQIVYLIELHKPLPKPDKIQLIIKNIAVYLDNCEHLGTTEEIIEKRRGYLDKLLTFLVSVTEITQDFSCINQLQQIERHFLMLVITRYVYSKNTFTDSDLYKIDSRPHARFVLKGLRNNRSALVKKGFIKETRFLNKNSFKIELSAEAIQAFGLEETRIDLKQVISIGRASQIDMSSVPSEYFTLIKQEKIKEEPLFFNKQLETKINLYENLLQKDDKVFETDDLFSGKLLFLFEGIPGSGKTAEAYQLAKLSNRNLIQINWQSVHCKWIGGSEKNLKKILDGIDQVFSSSRRKPIILFNEAETFLSGRMAATQYASHSLNTMVSMLLEWMEKKTPFGIVIFTANQKELMDAAFERRITQFNFDQPDESTRRKIWKARCDKHGYSLSETELDTLSSINISGADIDKSFRSYRLHQIAYNVNGFDLGIFQNFCWDQKWMKPKPIGFKAYKDKRSDLLAVS